MTALLRALEDDKGLWHFVDRIGDTFRWVDFFKKLKKNMATSNIEATRGSWHRYWEEGRY